MIEVGNDITIQDNRLLSKAQLGFGENDVHVYELMHLHHLKFEFEHNTNIGFKRGDFLDYQGIRFTLRHNTQPEFNDGAYLYEIQFDAPEILFQDYICFYIRQGLKETDFRLTTSARSHLHVVLDNIIRIFGPAWKIGTVEFDEIRYIHYDSMNIFNALAEIAEKYEGEWYVTGTTLHLVKRFAYGSSLDLKYGEVYSEISKKEGNREIITRLIAFGSIQNLPANYGNATEGEIVDGVVQRRLRISRDKGDYIDAYPELNNMTSQEGVKIFDDIYPHRIGEMTEVTNFEAQIEGSDDKVTFYRFKDAGLQFKSEYILPNNEPLKITFQSGRLNGMTFDLEFNPLKKQNEINTEAQIFEILRNDKYGIFLPNKNLYPAVGDKYILHNVDITLVGDQYVPAAELKLYEKAKQWLEDNLQDPSRYEIETDSKNCEDGDVNLEVGQRVKLYSDILENGFRESRVYGFEKKLYNKWDAKYTIADNPGRSRLKEVEKGVKELSLSSGIYESTDQEGVYLIKQIDTTFPTDHNAYSAKASDAKYLNKLTGGSVLEDTIFNKNLKVSGQILTDTIQNNTFSAGQFGSGYSVRREANGQSYIEVDNLLVRRETIFHKLTIGEITSVGGTIILSLASMVLTKVEDNNTSWRCRFDNANGTIPNSFRMFDQAICQRFTGNKKTYYWAVITGTGIDYIDISKTVKDGSDIPQINDELIQLGNRWTPNRQHAIVLSTYGSDAPSFKQYSGINSFDLTGKEVTVLSPTGNKIRGQFEISSHGTTSSIYKDRTYVSGLTYYLNDRVSYDGAYWICIADATIQIPNDSAPTWKRETTSQTMIDAVKEEALGKVEEAKLIASKAERDAESAQNDAENSLLYILLMINANTLTPNDKQIIQTNWLNIQKEYPKVLAEAVKMGIATSHYTSAYNNLNAYITPLLSDLHDMSEINADEFRQYFNKYHEAYIDTLNLISSKAKALADAAQLTANKAQQDVDGLETRFNTSFQVLDNKIAAKVESVDFNILGQRVGSAEANILHESNRITNTVQEINTRIADVAADGELYCRGTGLNRNAPRLLSLNGKEVYNGAGGRGLYLTVIRRSDLVVLSNHTYDVYGSTTARTELITKLNGLNDTVLVVLTSYDAVLFDNNLAIAMERCGGSGVILSGRHPYTLVGIPNIGKSNGIEVYRGIAPTDPQAEISTKIMKGIPTGINTIGNSLGNLQTTFNTKIDQTARELTLKAERAQTTADSKVTLVEVANSITVGQENIHIAGKELKITAPMIAHSIGVDDLKVGKNSDNTYNFRVGQNGKIAAKGATIDGTLQTAASGERILFNKDTNSIAVIDNQNNVKVLIKPTSLTNLNSIVDRTIVFSASGLIGSATITNPQEGHSSDYKEFISEIIDLPIGGLYDITLPGITLEATASVDPISTNNEYGIAYAYAEVSLTLNRISGASSNIAIRQVRATAHEDATPADRDFITISNQSPSLHSITGGKYRLQAAIRVQAEQVQGVQVQAAAYVSINGAATGYARSFSQFTEIAKDGIASVFGTNKYVHITQNAATFRYGSFGWRISENGIETTTNGINWRK